MDLNKWQIQLRKGMLDIVILNLLKAESRHGYDMVQQLKQVNGMTIREGNIYPVLARLQTDGLVDSESKPSRDGPPRRYFFLTPKGQQVMQEMNDLWDSLVNSVNQIRSGESHE